MFECNWFHDPIAFYLESEPFNIVVGKPTSSSSDACRFCGTRNGTELSAVGSVCSDPDCQVTLTVQFKILSKYLYVFMHT